MIDVSRFLTDEQDPAVPATSVADDPLALLTKLKSMLDAGLIREDEFDIKKAEILARM